MQAAAGRRPILNLPRGYWRRGYRTNER